MRSNPSVLHSYAHGQCEATLKNDDPDQSDEEGGNEVDDVEERLAKREERETKAKVLQSRAERQPTGKVVGIIKRGWRR